MPEDCAYLLHLLRHSATPTPGALGKLFLID